jgi:hypothetical protein
MTKEQIIQLMADAGLKTPARGDFIFIHWDQIAMLLAHEREQCAKVCETHAPTTTPTWVSYAAAIRARSTP